MKWYVVHTYASHEFKIKEAIEKGVKETDLEDKIGEILIPTQKHSTFGKANELNVKKNCSTATLSFKWSLLRNRIHLL